MPKKVEDKLLDHDFDGIKEFDNPLPPWWVGLFYLTIIISIVYILYYHVSGFGPSQREEYLNEINSFKNEKLAKSSGAPEDSFKDGETFTAMTEETSIVAGSQIYKTNCSSCHGVAGEGGIGPNMTDKFWLHGGNYNDIINTIVKGVPEKGMISWKPILSKSDILKVASYLETLKGTAPPNPKAPQGVEVGS
ncbi:MAG: cbb3-type cytochrome c oxidase N-terminal domain-containing protein [Candidatus Kapaibacteriota bacterium]|jgi:cytochrome c oxidase cbb3-type subunit 3